MRDTNEYDENSVFSHPRGYGRKEAADGQRMDLMKQLLIAVGISILVGGSAWAEGVKYNEPVYNPETKSYFELHRPKGQVTDAGIVWPEASEIAAGKEHQGVRGRLAVVKTAETDRFLRETFKPSTAAWIGLRFWCGFKKLQWITGDIHALNEFQRWGPVWNIKGRNSAMSSTRAECPARGGRTPYFLGIHYWNQETGFKWNANSLDTGLNALFIEYPTGKP
jgi:hypothetical protein